MFENASAYDQPLADGNWNMSGVNNMSGMFRSASNFNQALDGWVVSGATTMNSMFSSATAFNQPLTSWDVSGVSDMSGIFSGATDFNQSLATWDIGLVPDMTNTLSGTALSVANYDATINGWATIDGGAGETQIQSSVNLDANGLEYSSVGAAGRSILIETYLWTINFDELVTPLVPTNLIAFATSATDITLSWIDNATNETNYQVERADDYDFTTNVVVITSAIAADATSYIYDATLIQVPFIG